MKFKIYTKPSCIQCDQAKMLMKMKGQEFSEINIDVGQEKDATQEYIDLSDLRKQFPSIRMAPVIVTAEGTFVGSLPELKLWLK